MKAIDAFLKDEEYKNMNDKKQACTEGEIIAYLDGNQEFAIADFLRLWHKKGWMQQRERSDRDIALITLDIIKCDMIIVDFEWL